LFLLALFSAPIYFLSTTHSATLLPE
jgi:hypothetical protein